jgi:D-alanyl-D-alanine carboxypeptidase
VRAAAARQPGLIPGLWRGWPDMRSLSTLINYVSPRRRPSATMVSVEAAANPRPSSLTVTADVALEAIAHTLAQASGAGSACCIVTSVNATPHALVAASGMRQTDDPTSRAAVDDVWHLGSNTKAMTADLCALAVQDGKLLWTSSVGDILGKRVAGPYAQVTLHQLLTHTSGLPGGECPPAQWELAWSLHFGSVLFGRKPRHEQQMKFAHAVLSSVPPARAAGPPSEYTNLNYVIAAAMLTQATGEAWESFASSRLWGPLGMTSVGLGPAGSGENEAAARRHPWGHRGGGDTPLAPASPNSTNPASDNPDAIAPAGKVHVSIADWATFAAVHIDAEYAQQRLGLTRQTLTELHTAPAGANHACGWIATERQWAGGLALTHSGSNTFNHCTIWAAPNRHFAVMAMCNACPPGVHQMADRAIGEMSALHAARA